LKKPSVGVTDRIKPIPSRETGAFKTAIILVILSGTMAWLALLGWFTGHWQWLSLGTGCVPTAPATSTLLVLLSAILLAEIFGSGSAMLRWFCRVTAVLITVSGLVALLRPFFGWPSPLEQWLAGPTQTIDNTSVGQMSPLAGLAFLFAGSASGIKAFRFLDKKWSRRIEFGSSGLVFWISAAVILSYMGGAPLFSDRPIIPMALLTAIIFFFLSIAMALRYELVESPAASVTSGGKKTLVHKPLWILMSSLIVFVIIAGGVVCLRAEETRIRKEKFEELAAIGKLKVDQILRWRKERIANIRQLSEAPFLRKAVEEWLHKPDDATLKKDIVQRLKLETLTGIYTQVLLMDADAHILFSFPETAEVIDEIRNVVRKAWGQSGVFVSELHSGVPGEADVDTVAALRGVSGQPLAVAVLTSDAREYLFPILQAWPALHRSGETLLVRRDGENALFLNNLKYRKNTILTLRLPLTKIKVPAVQAVLGKTGPTVGPDYRGVEVFADLRPVPGTPWYLVTKVDAEEVLAEVRFRAIMTITMVLILIAGILGLIVLLFQIRLMKERETAAKMFQESEVMHRKLFENSWDAMMIIDPPSWKFVSGNSSMLRMFGAKEETELLLHSPWTLSPDRQPDGRISEEKSKAMIEIAVRTGHHFFEWVHKRLDGDVFHAEVLLTRTKKQGKLSIQASVRDITERKKTEEALRESERKLLEAQRMAQLGYWAWDVKTGDVKWSEEVFKIFRLDSEKFTPRINSIMALSPWPEDRGRDKKLIRRVTETREVGTYEQRFLRPDQSIGYYQSTFQGRYDEQGDLVSIVGTVMDITERKKAEEEIETLNRELEERVRQRTAELATMVKELEAFDYSVAHDLKAPLRAMTGFANILSEDYASKLDENAKRVIGVISVNARNMGKMIDDLLTLSHLGRKAIAFVDIDMTKLVQSVYHELKAVLFPDKAMEISVKPLPFARVDPVLAKQIFANLISNAMKFTTHKEKAVIEIGSYDKDGECVYYVKDNGAGFDMKYANKLFGIFQRLHARDAFEGTGIGLAIVKNAVQRHGGKVWAEGEVGQGATFYFTLPKGG
jgi:PAS domain S-box-containing protein